MAQMDADGGGNRVTHSLGEGEPVVGGELEGTDE